MLRGICSIIRKAPKNALCSVPTQTKMNPQFLFRGYHATKLNVKNSNIDDDDSDIIPEVDLSKIVVNSSRVAAEPSSLDREKELFLLKRSLSAQYNVGNYDMALRIAVDLLEKCEELYGKKNAVYASCLNNVALMQKMLGEYDSALTRYTDALHVYEDVQGKKSASYASTLSNMGSLYRLKASEATGMMKHQYLMRADEALSDSLDLRREILGITHRDTITSEILLAGLRRSQGKVQESIDMLHRVLETAKAQFSNNDIIIATIENNLGLTFKEIKEFDRARECYMNASLIRSKILGEDHPETIVALHNLAECLHAMGNEKEALAVQEKILSFVEVVDTEANKAEAAAPVAAPITPPAPHPHANMSMRENPESFSSTPPKRAAPQKESQYTTVSRKKR